MPASWDRVTLGRTGLSSSALGLGSSYGIGERDVERAFERGVNYLYWGSARRGGFGRAIRRLAQSHRDDMIVVVQSYARVGLAVRPSLENALRRLRIDHADFLLLGWWNKKPPRRILDAALRLRDEGKVHHLMISCHHRPSFVDYIADPAFGAIMVRYNAAHTGAEREVFPHLGEDPPGVVSYTTTRWGALLDASLVPATEPVPRASDCYRFALTHPGVSLCLAGPKNGAELDEAMAALDRGPMDADELAWMRRVGLGVHAASAARSWRNPAHLFDRVADAALRSVTRS
jgi:aryl-alcohol dehydrogenase-like predicted oxidoreductase